MPNSSRGAPDRSLEGRVLVFTPSGRDADLSIELLARAGIVGVACADVDALTAGIAGAAGTALVSEEALTPAAVAALRAALDQQLAWSDFPLVIVAGAAHVRTKPTNFDPLGNVTLLDRPMKVATMLKAVEAALRARQRQYASRRAIESRDQFLAMLGHELRNPLGAISLATELLARPSKPELAEKQRKIIERQSNHLRRLVDDLLDVARVTTGKIALHRSRVDLGEVVRSCVSALLPRAEAAGLKLSLDADAASSLVIDADRVRIEQVVNNVVTNAIKYTPAGGSIHVTAHGDATTAALRVRDTGIGLAPDVAEDMFDLFAQADRSLDRSQGGLGLGLTLVRSIARLHGGDATARSEGLGKGTELEVRFPRLADAPRPVDSTRDLASHAASSRRVVIVDDSDDIRELTCELLLREGHQVKSANDGPSAVSLVLDDHPEVAFIDIGLPGFDGYEVARRIRNGGDDDVVLVAVTGYGQQEDRRRAEEAGFDQHLVKPVALEALSAALAFRREA